MKHHHHHYLHFHCFQGGELQVYEQAEEEGHVHVLVTVVEDVTVEPVNKNITKLTTLRTVIRDFTIDDVTATTDEVKKDNIKKVIALY